MVKMLVDAQPVIRTKGAAVQPSCLSQPLQQRDSALPSRKCEYGTILNHVISIAFLAHYQDV